MNKDLEARLDSDTTTLLDGTVTLNDEEVPLRNFEFLRLALEQGKLVQLYKGDMLTEQGEAYRRDLNLAANLALGTTGKVIDEISDADYELPKLAGHSPKPLIEESVTGHSDFFSVAGLAYLDDLKKASEIALSLPEIEKFILTYNFEVLAKKGKVQYLYADNRLVIFKPGWFRDKLIMYNGIDRKTAVKLAELHTPKLSLKTKLGIGVISTLESILLLGLESFDTGLWDKSPLELGMIASIPFAANYLISRYKEKRKLRKHIKKAKYFSGQDVLDLLEGRYTEPKPWFGISLAISALFFAVVGTYIANTVYNVVQKKDYVASLVIQDTALDAPKDINTLTHLLGKPHLTQAEFMVAYGIIFEHIFGVEYNEDHMPVKFVESLQDLNLPKGIAEQATGVADIMSNNTFLRAKDPENIPTGTLNLALHELGHQIDPEFRERWLSTIVEVSLDYFLTSSYNYSSTDYAKRFEARADVFKVLIGLHVLKHGGLPTSGTTTPAWDPALALEGEDNYLWQQFNTQGAYTFANTIIEHLQLLKNMSDVERARFVYDNPLLVIIDTIRKAYVAHKK